MSLLRHCNTLLRIPTRNFYVSSLYNNSNTKKMNLTINTKIQEIKEEHDYLTEMSEKHIFGLQDEEKLYKKSLKDAEHS
jgi:hypothetical protein